MYDARMAENFTFEAGQKPVRVWNSLIFIYLLANTTEDQSQLRWDYRTIPKASFHSAESSCHSEGSHDKQEEHLPPRPSALQNCNCLPHQQSGRPTWMKIAGVAILKILTVDQRMGIVVFDVTGILAQM